MGKTTQHPKTDRIRQHGPLSTKERAELRYLREMFEHVQIVNLDPIGDRGCVQARKFKNGWGVGSGSFFLCQDGRWLFSSFVINPDCTLIPTACVKTLKGAMQRAEKWRK